MEKHHSYYGRISSEKPFRPFDVDFHKEAILNTITALKEMETSIMRNIADSKRELSREIESLNKKVDKISSDNKKRSNE